MPIVFYTGRRTWDALPTISSVVHEGDLFGKQIPEIEPAFVNLTTAAESALKRDVGMLGWVLWPHDAVIENMSLLDVGALLPWVQDRVVAMLMALASAAAVLAAVDYVFTRQSYMERMKMSRREIKEEFRQNDGDPMVKAKLRQIRMERSRQRMMANVPKARAATACAPPMRKIRVTPERAHAARTTSVTPAGGTTATISCTPATSAGTAFIITEEG